ncbi:MAG: HAD family phosphatase [Chloroflexota bacterium]|nr:HAD family phosphatase [Chloroflexota bacterium]
MTWLLCDYGEVLSQAQPASERAALVAASGMGELDFWGAYWTHRPAYDRADISVEDYWAAVLGRPVAPQQVRELTAIDVASWLHANPAAVASATRAGQRGYRLAILSNAPVEVAVAIDHAPWLAAFQPRVFSCRLRLSKPDPAAYHKILDHLAAEPEEIVFFDDRPENVATAKAVGIRAHLFTDASQLDGLPPV